MKILVVHNTYQQPGGEDVVCNNETRLLRQHGHEVCEYLEDNRRIPQLSSLRLGLETLWSRRSYRRIARVLAEFHPEVVHFHNTFPLISPSAYYAAKKSGAAVVQTLHNFRLLCSNGIFLREGKVCEDCLGKRVPLPGTRHRCYRQSRTASAGVAGMVTLHRALGTWRNQVDLYLALSEFARAKFVAGGLSEEKIVVKPNCLPDDPGAGPGDGGFALYIGRLSPEKGIATLLAAWEKLGHRVPLKIIGDGPEASRVREAVAQAPGITWLGAQPHEQVVSLLKQARFAVIPSVCYENFPLVAAEAFAVGTPVVASDVGSLAFIVEPGRTGLRFEPASATDLADKVLWLVEHPAKLAAMRRHARAEFELKYSGAVNHALLMSAYARAIRNAEHGRLHHLSLPPQPLDFRHSQSALAKASPAIDRHK